MKRETKQATGSRFVTILVPEPPEAAVLDALEAALGRQQVRRLARRDMRRRDPHGRRGRREMSGGRTG